MKSLTIFSAAILALTVGCDNVPAQDYGYDNDQYQSDQYQDQNNYNNQNSGQQAGYTQAPQPQNHGGEGITMHPVKDQTTGRPFMYIPYPSNWKINDNPPAGQYPITGPNGLTIGEFTKQVFMYTTDPNTNQIYQSAGQNVMMPAGVENVMTQKVIPWAKQEGMTLINQYLLTAVANNELSYKNKLDVGATQNIVKVVGSDWTDREGKKVFLVLHYTESLAPGIVFWDYYIGRLQVNSSGFEKAKSQYIYALANTKFNQNEINTLNAQMRGQRNADNSHFQAMENIRRKGQNDRATINAETNAYISNSQRETYEFNAHNNDVLQEQESNYLNNTNVVVNPYNGQETQVESGAQTYWIDNQGNYIKSDNPNYNPNNDAEYQGTWQIAPNKVYK